MNSILLSMWFVALALGMAVAQRAPSYRGAVAEFYPVEVNDTSISREGAHAVMSVNLRQMERFVSSAAQNGAQIIVFPEDGLYNFDYFSTRDSILPYLEEVPSPHHQLLHRVQSHIERLSRKIRKLENDDVDDVDLHRREDTVRALSQHLQETLGQLQRLHSSEKPSFVDELWGVDDHVQRIPYGFALKHLATMAMKYNITIVADVGEVKYCDHQHHHHHGRFNESKCPSDGRFQFNTQVAIDPSGVIIGKYRKTHLFPEDLIVFNYPNHPQLAYFDSSFGVRFGQFICFDIFFVYPSLSNALLRSSLGIRDFVFSTYWVNTGTIPMITAAQIQQGWSRTAQSNLLASNVGFGWLDSGSGIYSQGEPLEYFVNPVYNTTDSKLLIADIPILGVDPLSSQLEREAPQSDWHSTAHHIFVGESDMADSIPQHASIVMFSAALPAAMRLSNGAVSCVFSVGHMSNNATELPFYAMMAYDGPYFGGLLNASVCAIAKCMSEDKTSCFVPSIKTETVFSSFSITAEWNAQQIPLSIVGTQNGMLVEKDAVEFSYDHGSAVLKASAFNRPLLNAVLIAENTA